MFGSLVNDKISNFKLNVSPKKGDVGKIVEEGCLGKVAYVCC